MPLMSIARSFFIGREPTKGWGALRRMDWGFVDRTVRREMGNLGIEVRDSSQAVGTLSGG